MDTQHRKHRERLYTLALGVLLVAAMTAPASAARGAPASAAPGFLTRPSSERPLAIVVGYLKQHLAAYGLQPGDVDDVVATKVVRGSDSGATYVYLQQRHHGIDVYDAIANGAVMSDGRLVDLNSRFVGGLDAKANTTRPAVGRAVAAGAAAQALGLTGTAAFRVVRERSGPAEGAEVSAGGVSLEPDPGQARVPGRRWRASPRLERGHPGARRAALVERPRGRGDA